MKKGITMSLLMPYKMGFILFLSRGQGQASTGECSFPPHTPLPKGIFLTYVKGLSMKLATPWSEI